MSELATFELYEVGRDWPDTMVASATGQRDEALREIMHYALMYGQDGPVSVREVPNLSIASPQGERSLK